MSFGDLKVQDLIYEDSSNNEITVVIADLATKNNPTFTGVVTVPTAPVNDVSTKAASTAFVNAYYATKSGASFTGAVTGTDLTLTGNLTVGGTQTIINTQTLDVEDKQIEIGKVSSPSDTTADQGGIKLKGATDKTLLWVNATDAWTSSEHLHLLNNKNLILGTDSRGALGYNSSTSIVELGNRNTYLQLVDTGSAAGSMLFKVDDGNQFLINEHGFIAPGLGTVGMQWAPNANQDIVLGVRGRGSNTSHLAVVDLTSSHGSVSGADVKYGKIRFSWDNTPHVHDYGTAIIEGCSGAASSSADRATALKFYTAPTGSAGSYAALPVERLRIWKDGQIGLSGANYGSSGQVLTSGGSGAAPSWTSISGAPEVELTADGAIGNNVACNVKSNGKVEAVTEVAAGANYIAAATGTGASYQTITYDREHNKVVCFFRKNNDLKCVVGTPSGSGSTSTITWGSVQDLHDSLSDYVYMTAEYIHYNDTNKHVVAWITGTSGNVQLYVMVVDVAANGTVSHGGAQHVVSAGNSGANLRTKTPEIVNGHETNYPYILFYVKSTSDPLKSCDCQINTSNNTTTIGGAGSALNSGNYNDPIYAFKYLDRNTVMAKNSASQWYYNTRIAGSWKSTESFGGTSISRLTMFYDSTSSKVFAFYLESGTLKWKSGTPTTAGSGITGWSSDTTIRTTVSGWYGSQQIVEYDTKNSKYWLFFSEDSPAQKSFLYGFTISSAGAITWDSSPKEIVAAQRTAHNLFYETSLLNMVATSGADTYTSYSASSTMDPSNFLGWSSAAASDGAQAKVKVSGNTVTGLSGLTPGKKYYVQRNGSVGLTAVPGLSVEAGLALTSSSLLIR